MLTPTEVRAAAITDTVFIAAMRKAVAERGADYVYPVALKGWSRDGNVCRYVTTRTAEGANGKPMAACLIGAALAECGVPLADLAKHDNVKDQKGAAELLTAYTSVTQPVRRAASTAQLTQDSGHTWGKALEDFQQIAVRA